MGLNNHFYKRTLTILLFFVSAILLAQNENTTKVYGTVTTPNNIPLEGVNVILKNEFKGAVTNKQGEFILNNISAGTHTVQISFLGYQDFEKTINIATGNSIQLVVNLEEASLEMEAVQLKSKSAIRKINEQAYAVTSVSVKELYNSTSDAKQVLDRVPGVRILQEGGLGSDLDFSLNGFKGDQVKFFLNGIPMDNFGSSFSLSSIPVNSIDRIDVYKGVVPVWLGTDALGGAVNIITNQKNDYLDASYSIGSFNTHRASLNGAYTNNKTGFTVRGSMNYNYSDNNYNIIAKITDENRTVIDTAEVRRFHDRYRSLAATFETGWVDKSFADQLLIGVIASGDDKQLQNGATMAIPYGGVKNKSTSIISTLKYKKNDLLVEGLDVSLNTAYNITQTKNIDTLIGVRYNWYGEALETESNTDAERGTASDVTLDDTELTTQVNASYLFNEKHSLAFNHAYQNYKRETFDKRDPDNPKNQFPNTLQKNVMGLAYNFDYNKKWNTTVFGKAYFLNVETSKNFTTENSSIELGAYKNKKENYGYGIATSYFIFPELQVKASYEHTFRLPTAHELLGDGINVLSNPDLEAEESDNYNLGFAYNFNIKEGHKVHVESNFVYRNATNLIYGVVKGPTITNRNLVEAKAVGVEGNFSYNWKNRLKLGANITYQKITDEADKVYSDYGGYQTNFNKGAQIPNTPYLFGNANTGLIFQDVGFKKTELNLNYFVNFVEFFYFGWAKYGAPEGKADIPQQISHDLELVFGFQDKKYNISLQCQNLTDNLLYDKYRLQKAGRAFYVKFRYVIN